ncbi:MAG: hypothetical protein WDW38_003933 [Sanguina aurantia]
MVLSDELHNSSVKLVVQPHSHLCKVPPSMEADNVQPGSPSGSSGSSIDFLPATPTQGHYYGYHPTKAPWMHVPYNIAGVQPQTYVTQQPQALVVSQPYVASQPRSYVVKSRPPPPPPGSKKSLVIPAPLVQWNKPQAKGLKYRKLGASNQYAMYTTDGFPLAVQIANKALFGSLHCNTKLFDTKVCHLFVSLNEAAALAVLERAQLVLPDDLDTPPLEVNWKFYSDTDVPLCATIDTRPGGSTFLPKSSSFGVLAPGTPPIANFVPHSHNHQPVSGPPPTSTLMLPAPPLVGLSTPVQQPQPPAQVLAYRQMRASDRFNPYTLSGIPLVVRLAIKERFEPYHLSQQLFDSEVCRHFIGLNAAAGLLVVERALVLPTFIDSWSAPVMTPAKQTRRQTSGTPCPASFVPSLGRLVQRTFRPTAAAVGPAAAGSSLSASSSAASLLASSLPATPRAVGSPTFATPKDNCTHSASYFIQQQKSQGFMFSSSSTSCVDPAGAPVLDVLAPANPPPPTRASANEPQGQATYARTAAAAAERATVAERDMPSLASGTRGGFTYARQPATRNYTAKDITRAIRDDLIKPRFEGEHLNATHFKDSEVCRHFAGLSYAAAGLAMQLVPRRAGMVYHSGHKMEALLQSQLNIVIKNHCNMA